MSNNRGERRDRTERKEKSRKRKLETAIGYSDWIDEKPLGKFENNSISNEYANCGTPIKTNRKKGHSNYRSKGQYGPAVRWKPHDKRQLDRGDNERTTNEDQGRSRRHLQKDGEPS